MGVGIQGKLTKTTVENLSKKYEVLWKPNPPREGKAKSRQELFLSCPCLEALAEGGKGGGKTETLLMDFWQEVGKGFASYWLGIIFRETYDQLKDVIAKSKRLFPRISPTATYNESQSFWEFEGGERLYFRYLEKEEDYRNYHGWEIAWIGLEELTANSWQQSTYEKIRSLLRSSHPEVAKRKRLRATTNPYGPSHGWVKAYFVDPAPDGTIIRQTITDPETGKSAVTDRVRVYIPLEDNQALLSADPDYKLKNILSISDPNVKKAWAGGPDRWNISAGAALADCWNNGVHVLDPFPIPSSWRIDRAFDWGSSKPFACIWFAESDGSEVEYKRGVRKTFARGTTFAICEYYGWNGTPNHGINALAEAIGKEILSYERENPLLQGRVVYPGPADTSIFDTENGKSIAGDFLKVGVRWERANKSPGSRVAGLREIRKRLLASAQVPMTEPGLFVFNTCIHSIRTIPTLQRDPKKFDDIDSSLEDHCWDVFRYRHLTETPRGPALSWAELDRLPKARGTR